MYPIIVYCSFTVAALNPEPAIGRGTLVVQKSSDALTVAMFWRVTETEERTGMAIQLEQPLLPSQGAPTIFLLTELKKDF